MIRSFRPSFIVVLLLIAAWASTAHARCFPVPYPNPIVRQNSFEVGYFEVWDTKSGLPSDRIRCILPFRDKVLVGTEGDGLMVFDGSAWKSYSPKSDPGFPAPTVSTLVPVPGKNEVLAGTVNGLILINFGAQVSFTPIKLASNENLNVLGLGYLEGTLFMGTDQRAGVLEGDRFVPLDTAAALDATGFGCLLPHEGVMRFGSHKGLLEVNGRALLPSQVGGTDLGWVQAMAAIGSTTFVGGSTGLFSVNETTVGEVAPGTWVTCLSATPGLDRIIPGIAGPGAEFDAGAGKVQEESPETIQGLKRLEALQKALIEKGWKLFQKQFTLTRNSDIQYDPAYKQLKTEVEAFNSAAAQLPVGTRVTTSLLKGLWIGTQENGVILMTADGRRRELTTENSRLPANRISAVAACENGEAWIGTPEAGLLRYRKYKLSSDQPTNVWKGTPTLVRTIGEQVYVGTRDAGIVILDAKSGGQVSSINETGVKGFHRAVTGIAQDQTGRLWTTGDRGVWMRDQAGWHRFTAANGLPEDQIGCLEVDPAGRVYVTGESPQSISSQLAVFNGNGFTSFSVQALRFFLQSASAKEALTGLGLLDTYSYSFDLKNATEAIKAYDDEARETGVVAMLGSQEYLLLGTKAGNLFVFEGARFQRISSEGTGALTGMSAIARRRNGDRLFLARNKVMYMDGEHFESVPGVPKRVDRYAGLAVDDRNPNLFWVGFTSGSKGGIALFQEPLWQVVEVAEPVIDLTLVEPFVYVATENGVWRIVR